MITRVKKKLLNDTQMNIFLRLLTKYPKARNLVPVGLRRKIKSLFDTSEYQESLFKGLNPYSNTQFEYHYEGKFDFRIGIVYDVAQYHRYYQSACIDLGVGYEVVDLREDRWFEKLKASNVKVLMAWPSLTTSVLKEMLDERSRLIRDFLGIQVYPNPDEIFLLDNKRRVRDWLMVNSFEPPGTWCFYDKKKALEFCSKCILPIVFKSTKEGVSRGVVICRSRRQLHKLIYQCFGKGFVPRNTDKRNRQWNFVLLQEYLPNAEERRMIRIGDSYLAIDKVRVGDFHSGSGTMKWAKPERDFLDKTKEVTKQGSFRSMNVDFFIAEDQRVVINELHTMFHGPVIKEKEGLGRYRYLEDSDEWVFEEGSYYRNYCCNLRVMDALSQAGIKTDYRMDWLAMEAFEYASLPKEHSK